MRYDITPKNFLLVLNKVISKKEECTYSGISDSQVVLKGLHNTINEKYCKDNNIRVENTFNEGGCIVDFEGDIEFGIIKVNGFEVGLLIAEKIAEWLRAKGLNAIIDNNDILVDGYKCGSYSSVNIGDRTIYTGFHISINVNVEQIRNICTKEMRKIPKGLSDYSIDNVELHSYIKILLKKAEENEL